MPRLPKGLSRHGGTLAERAVSRQSRDFTEALRRDRAEQLASFAATLRAAQRHGPVKAGQVKYRPHVPTTAAERRLDEEIKQARREAIDRGFPKRAR